MARKLELTWHKPTGRWKKFRKGKLYYFKFGTGKSDMEGYRQALEAWRALEKQLIQEEEEAKPGREAYDRAIALHQEKIDWFRRFGSDEDQASIERHEAKIDELNQRWASAEPPAITVQDLPWQDKYGSPSTNAVWRDRKTTLSRVKGKVVQSRLVGENINEFLTRKRNNAKSGDISIGRCDVLRLGLERFQKHFGADRAIDEIDGDCLIVFRDDLVRQAADKKISRAYARDVLASTTQWVRWLWTSGRLENLPRVLRDRGNAHLRIAVPTTKIKTFKVADLKALFGVASPRTKLYLLLALNCGYLQKDIADLKKSEIDLKKGTIKRKRSKTKKETHTPEVTYKLWGETLNLLKKELSKHKELALTNANGERLWREWHDEHGTRKKVDNIKTAYIRLLNRKDLAEVQAPEFKSIRKTGASLLSGHEVYGRYVQYYLGHAPRSVAERHYEMPSDVQFFKACVWLGEQLNIA